MSANTKNPHHAEEDFLEVGPTSPGTVLCMPQLCKPREIPCKQGTVDVLQLPSVRYRGIQQDFSDSQ